MEKKQKLTMLRAVVDQPLETMLKGVYLEKGKQSYKDLKQSLKRSNVTIKGIALTAMQLGKYLHENNCQDDSCVHCACEYKGHAPIRHKLDVRELKECYEHCSAEVSVQERKNKEKKRKSSHKASNPSEGRQFKKTMFTFATTKFPRNFRYKSEMVSLYFVTAQLVVTL